MSREHDLLLKAKALTLCERMGHVPQPFKTNDQAICYCLCGKKSYRRWRR